MTLNAADRYSGRTATECDVLIGETKTDANGYFSFKGKAAKSGLYCLIVYKSNGSSSKIRSRIRLDENRVTDLGEIIVPY